MTQPRQPCFKLGIRFDREDMIRRFLLSGRPGFYAAVVREGEIGAGDPITFTTRAPNSLSVAAIVDLRLDDEGKEDELRRAAALTELSGGWRDHFRKRLGER